jgi:hypothetical protein
MSDHEQGSDYPIPVNEMVASYEFTKDDKPKTRKKGRQEGKDLTVVDSSEYRVRQDQIAKLGLSKVIKGIERDQLPEIALSIIADHGLRVLGGEWEVRTAEEATKIGKVWHDIFRLEMGEPTSISSSQDSESPEQRKTRFEELKLEAKRRTEGNLRAIAGDAG